MAALPCRDRGIQCSLFPTEHLPSDCDLPKAVTVDTYDTKSSNWPVSKAGGSKRRKNSRKGHRKKPTTRSEAKKGKQSAIRCLATVVRRLRQRTIPRLPGNLGQNKTAVPEICRDIDQTLTTIPKTKASNKSNNQSEEGTSHDDPEPDRSYESSASTSMSSVVPDAGQNDDVIEDSEDRDILDHNCNACKRREKKRALIIARQYRNPKTTPRKTAGSSMVQLSSLKPINAICSKSGLGLVVTYRPVFSEITPKRTTRKIGRASYSNCVYHKIKVPVCRRDSGTNPRTPSPEKQRKTDKSQSFFDQIDAFAKKRDSSGERENGVTKWLQNMISSQPKNHRTPSPALDKKETLTEKEQLKRPYTVANRSARKSPVPGPSWAPDEFTRVRSPLTKRPATASSSLLATRPTASEGWTITRTKSPGRKSAPPKCRSQDESGGSGRQSPTRKFDSTAGDEGHVTLECKQNTSFSRKPQHSESKQRSQTQSPSTSRSHGSIQSRYGWEDDYFGKGGRHRHHHRHHLDWKPKEGASGCQVM